MLRRTKSAGTLIALAGLVALTACSGSDGVRSGPGPTTQLTSDGDDTAARPAKSAQPTESAAPSAPTEPSTSEFLMVVGSPQIPTGEPEALSVVLLGRAPQDQTYDSIPVVVRNNTSSTVYGVEASATARGADGTLSGSGSSQGFAPTTVQPGEWTFGYIYFGSDLPADATIDATATAETARSFIGSVDVKPVETNVVPGPFSGKQIVGIVANETDEEISGPISVDVICFDSAGTGVSGTQRSFTDADTIPSRGTASFAIDLFDMECPIYAVGASGFDF